MTPRNREAPRPDDLANILEGEPHLIALARQAKDGRPTAMMSVHATQMLRDQLMIEARGRRRRFGFLRPSATVRIAWGMAVIGLAFGVAGVASLSNHGLNNETIILSATSSIDHQHSVALNNTLTVAFNEPMNETSVDQAVTISPATAFTTSWTGNTLVIHPLHSLAANTPYTIAIKKTVARTSSGTAPAHDLTISFGTAPSAAPTPSNHGTTSPPTASTTPLGSVTAGSALSPAGGSDVAGASVLPATPSGSAPSPAGSPTTSPSITPSATTTPSTTPGGILTTSTSAAPSLGLLSATGQTVLGPETGSVAVDASGTQVASVNATTGAITVTSLTGTSRPLGVIATPSSPLCWLGEDHISYVANNAVTTVSIPTPSSTSNLPTSETPLPPSATVVAFAPGCNVAVIGEQAAAASPSPTTTATTTPSAGPQSPSASTTLTTTHQEAFLNLSTGSQSPIASLVGQPSFTHDGSTAAWLSSNGAHEQLNIGSSGGAATTIIPLTAQETGSTNAVISPDGALIAIQEAGATGLVDVVSTTTSSVVGTVEGSGATTPVAWDPSGDALITEGAVTYGTQLVALASIPASWYATGGVGPATTALMTSFLDAEVAQDTSSVYSQLSASTDLSGTLPQTLSRGYIVSRAQLSPSTITYLTRLVRDGVNGAAPQWANQTVTLTSSNGRFQITSVVISPLGTIPAGPNVLTASLTQNISGTTVQISFDSDLNPATVAKTFTLTPAGSSTPLVTTATYDVDTRTVTVTSTDATATLPVTLTGGTSLEDINETALSASFSTPLSA